MNEDWKTDVAKLKAAQPKHILFLCVANSARSQMAEGIARSLAPASVRISSAGSQPSHVRSEVITVLKEIGIDISNQYSKGLDAIDAGTVDAVITLCAEEVCPVFPRKVMKFHWGLPDPAGFTGSGEEKLSSYRAIRDELMLRLKQIF